MITVLYAPDEISMTGNPICYKLRTSLTTTKFLGLKLWVETEFMSGFYTNVVVLASPPDINLETEIYLEENIAAELKDFVPNFALSTMQKAKQLCKRYYVEIAELDETQSTETATYITQPVRYAMKGKFPRQDFPKRGANLLPFGNLLYRRNTRQIGLQQKDWVSLMPDSDISDLSFVVFINYTNNSTDSYTETFGLVRKYEPAFIPIGFLERLYNNRNPSLKISWISISLPFGRTITLLPCDLSSARMATEVHYYNNAGGLESYIFSGQLKEDKESSFAQFQHYQAYNYGQLDGEFKNYEKTVRKSGQLFSGFMPYPEDTYLLDAIESEIFYIRQPNGDFYPANNVTGKQEAINTFQRIMSLKLEFNYAFNE